MTPLEQAFERFYMRDRDPNSPITIDALLRGADGQYFHQHMRSYLKFFEGGFDHGMATATEAMLEAGEPNEPDPCAGGHIPIGWTGTVHCEVCNVKLGDEVLPENEAEPEQPKPASDRTLADPYCWDCSGKGDGKGGKCPTCWTHPF